MTTTITNIRSTEHGNKTRHMHTKTDAMNPKRTQGNTNNNNDKDNDVDDDKKQPQA